MFHINRIIKLLAFTLHCCHYLEREYKKHLQSVSKNTRFHRYVNLDMQERLPTRFTHWNGTHPSAPLYNTVISGWIWPGSSNIVVCFREQGATDVYHFAVPTFDIQSSLEMTSLLLALCWNKQAAEQLFYFSKRRQWVIQLKILIFL